MKKLLLNVIAILSVICVTCFAGCNEHEHTFSNDWSYDKTHHWHASVCDCSEKADYDVHTFSNDKCLTCDIEYLSVAFNSGQGTEQDPYIISNTEELQNIAIVPTFSYFKIKDGITQLDLSNWTPIRLNGCFDGNNVKLNNLSTRLFTHIGNNEEKNIYLKNFEVNINFVSTTHAALIKEIDNFGTTTFENVKIHGYIEGESNTATLFSFGTENGYSGGSNYTVELKNVKIDATLVCVTAQPLGAFIAHAYAGAGNKLTLKVDNDTEFTGNVYSGGDKKYNEYVSIGSYEIYKENQLITQTEIDTKAITKVTPVQENDGYTVEVSENVSKITISITAQISAYDAQGNTIPNLTGITLTLTSKTISENLNGKIKIFDLFESAEIVNNASNYDAKIVNDVLKIYVAQQSNYKTGTVRLQVQQYNAQGDIKSCGTLNIFTLTLD